MAQNTIKNPELVLAMNVLKAEDTPAARKAFEQALASARLLAPVKLEKVLSEQDRQPDGSVALQEKTQVKYLLFNRSDGKKVFPAFTDWDELHKWSQEPCQTLVLTLKDYSRIFAHEGAGMAGVAVNPMGQNMLFLPKTGAASAQTLFDKSKPVNIVTLKDMPQALVDGVQQAMAAEPAVQEAWLKLMHQEEKKVWLLVVHLDEGTDAKAACTALGKAIHPYCGGIPVTVTPVASTLGQKAIANTLPLYLRG